MKSLFPIILLALPITLSAQTAKNISLYATIEYEVDVSDVWGYTAPDNTEYALVGLADGTSIVDLSDPYNPKEISRIKGGFSEWKDIKTYKDKAYITGEYPEGLQIIDLSVLPDTIPSDSPYYFESILPSIGTIGACHNLYIEEKTGVAYLSGCVGLSGGVIMLDLTGEIPVYLGKTNGGYSHDVYVRNDTLYSSDIFDGYFTVVDVTDKSNPMLLATQGTPAQFTHNTWLSDDGKTIFTTDETNNAPIAAYDISDLEDIQLLDQFYPEGSKGTDLVPHNVHVKNDFLIASYYTEGVVIIDAARPSNLVQVGQYDTYVGANGDYLGTWGAFPFFDSDIMLASDIKNGLFILNPTYKRATYFEGMIRDSISKNGLANVKIDLVFRNTIIAETLSELDGFFSLGTIESGLVEVTFSKEDYQSKTIEINVINGQLEIIDIDLLPTTIVIAADHLVGCAPHQVRFISGGIDITEFEWIFEGGTPSTSTDANPLVTYELAGTYDVQLNSRVNGEPINKTQVNLISINDSPYSNFSFERERRIFRFTNLSENMDSVLWDFGDGTTSKEVHPTHQFAEGILPIVTLTATNECGAHSFSTNLADGTPSLESLQLLNTFHIHPNPFAHQAVMEYELSTTLHSIDFQLMDISGRVLEKIPLSAPTGHFLIGSLSLPKGIYFAQLVTEKGNSELIKLVRLGN